MSSHDLFAEARRLHGVACQINDLPSWVAVCRACARTNNARRNERDGCYTRLDLSFFNNLERIWWTARAQVETRTRGA